MGLFASPAVAAPVGESRSNNQLFGALLDRLGLSRPGEPTSDGARGDAIFAASPNGAWLRKQIAERGIAEPPGGTNRVMFVDAFPGTPDAKIHLVPDKLDREAPHGLRSEE